jgi:hypothetical protein
MYPDKRSQTAFAEKGLAIYEIHRVDLEKDHMDQIVAIDIDSGEYVIGPTLGKANDLAYPHYPDKCLYFVRIGASDSSIVLQTW